MTNAQRNVIMTIRETAKNLLERMEYETPNIRKEDDADAKWDEIYNLLDDVYYKADRLTEIERERKSRHD